MRTITRRKDRALETGKLLAALASANDASNSVSRAVWFNGCEITMDRLHDIKEAITQANIRAYGLVNQTESLLVDIQLVIDNYHPEDYNIDQEDQP